MLHERSEFLIVKTDEENQFKFHNIQIFSKH